MMGGDMSQLTVEVRQGETLNISGQATVELLHKKGQVARLRVTARRDVQIDKGKPVRDVRCKHGTVEAV